MFSFPFPGPSREKEREYTRGPPPTAWVPDCGRGSLRTFFSQTLGIAESGKPRLWNPIPESGIQTGMGIWRKTLLLSIFSFLFLSFVKGPFRPFACLLRSPRTAPRLASKRAYGKQAGGRQMHHQHVAVAVGGGGLGWGGSLVTGVRGLGLRKDGEKDQKRASFVA